MGKPIELKLKEGDVAPDFTAPTNGGGKVSLSDFKGKTVVLEWTNYDCPFVKKHYDSKNMQGLQAKYSSAGVVWLSVCSSAPGKQGHYEGAKWNELRKEKGSSATAVLLDPDGTVGKTYGAKTTPHLFIVNAEGKLVYDGAIDDKPSMDAKDIPDSKNFVAEALDALAAGNPVPTPKTTSYGCSVKY